ncbi:protein phosphatase regulatory subunit Sds22 [Thecaphora frezii]
MSAAPQQPSPPAAAPALSDAETDADHAAAATDAAAPQRVQVVGDLPPKPVLPSDAAAAADTDSSDDDDGDKNKADARELEEEDPQTEDEEGGAGGAPQLNGFNAPSSSAATTTQYGSVTVQTGWPPVGSGPPQDEIPDDSELLANYPDTEEVLDLSHLRISTTRNLGLPRFRHSAKRLCLRQNQIGRIRSKDIGVLTELRELDLYDNSLEKVSGLDGCTKLETLDLSFNNIHHIANVAHLGRCKTLYFVQNKISKVRPDDLRGPIAESLTSLELGGNRLRSIDNLDHLHRLEELWLGKNKITSLDGLATLANLRVLSIQSNRITQLRGLETLVNLEELYISHNGLTKLEGLEHNRKLKTLDISANMIETIENVAHLSEMEEFWANDNKIKDLNHIESQLGPKLMPKLETVYLEGNPAQRTEGPAYRRKVKLLLPQISQIDATFVR